MCASELYADPAKRQGASQIAARIEADISSGGLKPGQALPPIRDLATDLGVNASTVATAYRTLRERGIVVTRGRGGTRVSPGPALPTRGPIEVPPGVRNLADGNPDPAFLPDLERAWASCGADVRLYGAPANLPSLLEVAQRRFEEDGIPAQAITVVGGAMDAFERILHTHLVRGDRIAIEDPGHSNLIDLVRSLGLDIEPVAVDAHGIVPGDLQRALRRGARAVAITPRAHNPSGAVLTSERVAALKDVLGQHPDVMVIEDDHSAGVAGASATTVTSPSLRRRAVIRSVSKTLGPDLRLAVVAGDGTTVDQVEARRLLGTGWVSGVLQHLVAHLLTNPDARELVAAAERAYTERREALIAALGAQGITSHGDSGLNVWIPVPEEQIPARRLLDLGWAVSPGQRFRLTSAPGLRVTITTLLPTATERLAADFATALRPDRRTRAT